MNLDDFILSGWPLVAWLLIIAALAVMVGVGLGYLNASTDLAEIRKVVHAQGFEEGIKTAWGLIGSDARRVAAVTLGEDRPDLRTMIFDQDEPPLQRAMREGLHVTEAARAIELRGDD